MEEIGSDRVLKKGRKMHILGVGLGLGNLGGITRLRAVEGEC
jgi:hypothetical protein